MTILNPDRLFPADPTPRAIARRLYSSISCVPILSPHGHANPRWFSENAPFPDPAQLFVVPDHYIYRMLYSQGIPLERLGIGSATPEDPRLVWRIFAEHYYLFRGTPTRLWLDYAFEELFGLDTRLSAANADEYYDRIAAKLTTTSFRPRSLFERFHIEVLATTDSPVDSLEHHSAIRASHFEGRIIPTFRGDAVVDPDFPGFAENLARLGEITHEKTATWHGYLAALRLRRLDFKALVAPPRTTATQPRRPPIWNPTPRRNSSKRSFRGEPKPTSANYSARKC